MDDFQATSLDGSSTPIDAPDTTSFDLLHENLLEDERARATGFVGNSSELQWLRGIMAQLERTEHEHSPTVPFAERSGASVHSLSAGNLDRVSAFTFYLDCESVDTDYIVDPQELPTPGLAEQLLDCYMATVHSTFPIISTESLHEYRDYLRSLKNGKASLNSPKQQAVLNAVLAIGARYSHLINATWQADDQDHLIYQARARAFGLNEFVLTNHPDVLQIQVTGLLAFYYLSVGQISRSWIVLGVALRFACALGLHVRNEDPTAQPIKKELLVRVWWSLFSLERQLSIMTGRAGLMVDSYCSVPLPIPVPEEQLSNDGEAMDRLRRGQLSTPILSPVTSTFFSARPPPPVSTTNVVFNQGSYFKAIVQMGTISQNIITSLYSAGTMIRSAGNIQQDIVQLGQRLDAWARALPQDLNFNNNSLKPQRRERMVLGLQFYSAQILLTRPCLGGVGHNIEGQSLPESFCRRMNEICIDAARRVVDFLPDQPDPYFLYEFGPWWCIIHSLMQALSVFLLALLYSSTVPVTATLSDYVKKLLTTLDSMSDPLAQKAYAVSVQAVEGTASRLSLDRTSLGLMNYVSGAGARAAYIA